MLEHAFGALGQLYLPTDERCFDSLKKQLRSSVYEIAQLSATISLILDDRTSPGSVRETKFRDKTAQLVEIYQNMCILKTLRSFHIRADLCTNPPPSFAQLFQATNILVSKFMLASSFCLAHVSL